MALNGTELVLTGDVLGLYDYDVIIYTDDSLVTRITNPKFQAARAVADDRYTNTIDGQTVDGNVAFKYAMARNQYKIWLSSRSK